MTFIDQQHIIEDDAFVEDAAAVRRHGAGRSSADIGVVPTCRDKGIRDRIFRMPEHRHYHRDIGQMGAAMIGIVEEIGIAGPHPARGFGTR